MFKNVTFIDGESAPICFADGTPTTYRAPADYYVVSFDVDTDHEDDYIFGRLLDGTDEKVNALVDSLIEDLLSVSGDVYVENFYDHIQYMGKIIILFEDETDAMFFRMKY